MVHIDRSRVLAYQACPRQRWLAYHAHGMGLQRKSKALALSFGSAFHEGCEVLLTGGGVESAVLRARLYLANAFAEGEIGFDGEQPADIAKAIEYGKEEQAALAEALLRAWDAFEGPQFRDQFEVLEVEREGRALLQAGRTHRELLNPDDPTPVDIDDGHWIEVKDGDDLVLMFRPDALVRERESGDIYVISWKTCSSFGQRTVDQARHDQQSMSEPWGWMQNNPDKHVEGVLYKWIVKGRRSLDKYDGLFKQSSHLIYAWKKAGPSPEEDDYSWAYEYEREDGSGSTRLGKGWRKIPVWREYPGGVKQWITDLYDNKINPRHVDALQAVFPQSLPVERRADEIDHWREQVTAQEVNVAHSLELLEQTPEAGKPQALDVLFPQYSHSCSAFSGCPYVKICWEGVPAEVGEFYEARKPNHPELKEGEE